MSVRPILLQVDGAVFGTPGAYRALPPKRAGLYAGSELLEEVTYYTVNASGEAELKTVKAYPFYCDSISGGTDTSGDGTLANPWRSVNYSLAKIIMILGCLEKYCCPPKIVLRIKGTADYPITWIDYNFSGRDSLMIEPWDLPYIEVLSFDRINRCIMKNIRQIKQPDALSIYMLFTDCKYCVFNNCGVDSLVSSLVSYIGCFYRNWHSVFYNCFSNLTHEYPSRYGTVGAVGFESNDDSIFFETTSVVRGNSSVHGFGGNPNSSFYSCNGNVSMIGSTGWGCGFFFNQNSIYLDCVGNSIGGRTCDI